MNKSDYYKNYDSVEDALAQGVDINQIPDLLQEDEDEKEEVDTVTIRMAKPLDDSFKEIPF